jgi:regulatory protein
MKRGVRQISDGEELYEVAVGALARRAHSVHQMCQFLERHATHPSLADAVLGRLRASGMVDDARYARQFARDRAANRRQGWFRIARELRARGVADRFIQEALQELASEVDEEAMIRHRVQKWLRRHGVADPRALDRRRTASLYQSLLRAGFAGDRIRSELQRVGQLAEGIGEGELQEE